MYLWSCLRQISRPFIRLRKTIIAYQKHNALRDVLFQYLISDNSDCKVEQGCSSNNYKKPGDLFHPDFLDGRSAFFDITVCNSLLPRFIAIATTYPGEAADAGEREKDLKHDDDVLQAGSQFFPLAVEALGMWSPQSLETLKVFCQESCLPPQHYYQPVCVPAT